MKTICTMLAAISALAVAAPLAAQPQHADRATRGDSPSVAQLRRQLDAGIARGTITRHEATTLRTDLNALVRLRRIYGRSGFSLGEWDTIRRRSVGLQRQIRRAESNSDRGAPRRPAPAR